MFEMDDGMERWWQEGGWQSWTELRLPQLPFRVRKRLQQGRAGRAASFLLLAQGRRLFFYPWPGVVRWKNGFQQVERTLPTRESVSRGQQTARQSSIGQLRCEVGGAGVGGGFFGKGEGDD